MGAQSLTGDYVPRQVGIASKRLFGKIRLVTSGSLLYAFVMIRHHFLALCLSVPLVMLANCHRAEAQAAYYLVNQADGLVADYSASGSLINGNLIGGFGGENMILQGGDLYLADGLHNRVSEYTTSGAVVNLNLVSGLLGQSPFGIAIANNVLYVGTSNGIATYTTSGTLLNPMFVGSYAEGFTVSGNNLFLMTQSGGNNMSYIEEFNAMTGALENPNFAGSLYDCFNIAVSGGFLYTGSYAGGDVFRFNLDGTSNGNGTLISGLGDGGVENIAVDNNVLYVSDDRTNVVAEYDATTGTLINSAFIAGQPGSFSPSGLVVAPESPSWADTLFGLTALTGCLFLRKLHTV